MPGALGQGVASGVGYQRFGNLSIGKVCTPRWMTILVCGFLFGRLGGAPLLAERFFSCSAELHKYCHHSLYIAFICARTAVHVPLVLSNVFNTKLSNVFNTNCGNIIKMLPVFYSWRYLPAPLYGGVSPNLVRLPGVCGLPDFKEHCLLSATDIRFSQMT